MKGENSIWPKEPLGKVQFENTSFIFPWASDRGGHEMDGGSNHHGKRQRYALRERETPSSHS